MDLDHQSALGDALLRVRASTDTPLPRATPRDVIRYLGAELGAPVILAARGPTHGDVSLHPVSVERRGFAHPDA